jgi:hypothetical protein
LRTSSLLQMLITPTLARYLPKLAEKTNWRRTGYDLIASDAD